MTIKELIELLQELKTPDVQIVRIGHFGELYEMDKYDFRLVHNYQIDNLLDIQKVPVLAIYPPDIGSEPD